MEDIEKCIYEKCKLWDSNQNDCIHRIIDLDGVWCGETPKPQ